MIFPSSNAEQKPRYEKSISVGGAYMKNFLSNQHESPYYINEQERFSRQNYSDLERQNKNRNIEENKVKLEKKRIEQMERNIMYVQKSQQENDIRINNTYQSGIPVNPINQQYEISKRGQQYLNDGNLGQVKQLTRLQNLQQKQSDYNILTGAGRQMLYVPDNQKQEFDNRWKYNEQIPNKNKAPLFY